MRATDQKQNHTASYYAATANDVTHYPALEGSQSADICVVGGGFTGVATALTLAERGYSTGSAGAPRAETADI
jgi:NADH dehydrogenase FAD-containing subunit